MSVLISINSKTMVKLCCRKSDNMKLYRQIYKKIKKYQTIVLAHHIGPDPDALGRAIHWRAVSDWAWVCLMAIRQCNQYMPIG